MTGATSVTAENSQPAAPMPSARPWPAGWRSGLAGDEQRHQPRSRRNSPPAPALTEPADHRGDEQRRRPCGGGGGGGGSARGGAARKRPRPTSSGHPGRHPRRRPRPGRDRHDRRAGRRLARRQGLRHRRRRGRRSRRRHGHRQRDGRSAVRALIEGMPACPRSRSSRRQSLGSCHRLRLRHRAGRCDRSLGFHLGLRAWRPLRRGLGARGSGAFTSARTARWPRPAQARVPPPSATMSGCLHGNGDGRGQQHHAQGATARRCQRRTAPFAWSWPKPTPTRRPPPRFGNGVRMGGGRQRQPRRHRPGSDTRSSGPRPADGGLYAGSGAEGADLEPVRRHRLARR